jgi:hypothetical protein
MIFLILLFSMFDGIEKYKLKDLFLVKENSLFGNDGS